MLEHLTLTSSAQRDNFLNSLTPSKKIKHHEKSIFSNGSGRDALRRLLER